MGCHFLLQGIFLTQGLNPGLLHCRQILCHLSSQGSPLYGVPDCSSGFSAKPNPTCFFSNFRLTPLPRLCSQECPTPRSCCPPFSVPTLSLRQGLTEGPQGGSRWEVPRPLAAAATTSRLVRNANTWTSQEILRLWGGWSPMIYPNKPPTSTLDSTASRD